jgi:hypothetical protein
MSSIGKVAESVRGFNAGVEAWVEEVRGDSAAADKLMARWRDVCARVAEDVVVTPTGLTLPRLALPDLDEAGAVARYLYGEGLPGEFPFLSSAYPEMYLEQRARSPVRRNQPASSRDWGWRRTLMSAFICSPETSAVPA